MQQNTFLKFEIKVYINDTIKVVQFTYLDIEKVDGFDRSLKY